MGRIDRYLLAQLLSVFAFFTIVLVSVYWVNRAARLFDQIIGDGQSFWVFLELSALTLPQVIRLMLPLSAFAAAVYVAIRLSRDNELAVLQAAGLSYLRLLRPVVMFGVLVALMLALLMHVLMPMARAQLAERQVQIAENITARLLRPGEFLRPADGVVVYLRDLTPEGQLIDLYLSDRRKAGVHAEYHAASAVLAPGPNGPVLVMLDGVATVTTRHDNRLTTISFSELTYDVGGLVGPAGRRTDVSELSTKTLRNMDSAEMDALQITWAQVRFELAARIAEPLLAIMTPLLGFAAIFMGQFSRLGPWRQVLGAIVMLAMIQSIGNAASAWALRDATLAWLAYVSLGAALVVLTAMLIWMELQGRVLRSRQRSGAS